ncbi:uncharacterized protein V1510DRAFT_416642 [Dipodascopsis tothii]|uniref:uncharacterized protein n=1 Tax=Dipodascopsis tothii TaxID=44089 RepID=UPI0034CD1BEA
MTTQLPAHQGYQTTIADTMADTMAGAVADAEAEVAAMRLQRFPHELPTVYYDVAPSPDVPEIGMFFLVPGNPGLPQFYGPFLLRLRDLLPGWRLVCVSQAGGCASSTGPPEARRPVIGLDAQVVHKVAVLTRLLGAHGYLDTDRKVVLAGHSIGAWMVQQMVVALAAAGNRVPVSQAVLLFPTVRDIAQSPSGVRLTRLLGVAPWLPQAVATLAGGLRALPATPARWLVAAVMGGPPPHALEAAYDLAATPAAVAQTLGMAAEEMALVAAESPAVRNGFWPAWAERSPAGAARAVVAAERTGAQIAVFFAPSDHWVADRTRAEIMSDHGVHDHVYFAVVEGSSHAFCVKESELMAEQVAAVVV